MAASACCGVWLAARQRRPTATAAGAHRPQRRRAAHSQCQRRWQAGMAGVCGSMRVAWRQAGCAASRRAAIQGFLACAPVMGHWGAGVQAQVSVSVPVVWRLCAACSMQLFTAILRQHAACSRICGQWPAQHAQLHSRCAACSMQHAAGGARGSTARSSMQHCSRCRTAGCWCARVPQLACRRRSRSATGAR